MHACVRQRQPSVHMGRASRPCGAISWRACSGVPPLQNQPVVGGDGGGFFVGGGRGGDGGFGDGGGGGAQA